MAVAGKAGIVKSAIEEVPVRAAWAADADPEVDSIVGRGREGRVNLGVPRMGRGPTCKRRAVGGERRGIVLDIIVRRNMRMS